MILKMFVNLEFARLWVWPFWEIKHQRVNISNLFEGCKGGSEYDSTSGVDNKRVTNSKFNLVSLKIKLGLKNFFELNFLKCEANNTNEDSKHGKT